MLTNFSFFSLFHSPEQQLHVTHLSFTFIFITNQPTNRHHHHLLFKCVCAAHNNASISLSSLSLPRFFFANFFHFLCSTCVQTNLTYSCFQLKWTKNTRLNMKRIFCFALTFQLVLLLLLLMILKTQPCKPFIVCARMNDINKFNSLKQIVSISLYILTWY